MMNGFVQFSNMKNWWIPPVQGWLSMTIALTETKLCNTTSSVAHEWAKAVMALRYNKIRCWSLILRVSQSRRAGFGRAAEEQRENDGKAEDDRWKRTMTMEKQKTTNEDDKMKKLMRYIYFWFILSHSFSFIKGGSSLSFAYPWIAQHWYCFFVS